MLGSWAAFCIINRSPANPLVLDDSPELLSAGLRYLCSGYDFCGLLGVTRPQSPHQAAIGKLVNIVNVPYLKEPTNEEDAAAAYHGKGLRSIPRCGSSFDFPARPRT